MRDGFVALRGAVDPETAAACRELIWGSLEGRGLRRDDPGRWPSHLDVTDLGGEAFTAAATAPALTAAYDELIGRGRWMLDGNIGSAVVVRFPREHDRGNAGYHIEGSYAGPDGSTHWVNIRSRARGLLVLYLFSDVDEASAPTRIRPGSHRDAARVLAPAGDEGLPWVEAATAAADASAGRGTALATGRAGDVFVCHPFLVHAASWPHQGRLPRMMAQPGVALHTQFPLTAPLSPVEQAIVAGIAD